MGCAVESFGKTLLGYIAASRFRSQRQFAKAIEMEPTYLNRIIKGNVQRPDPETLRKMADALERPYALLMDDAGYPPMPDAFMPPTPTPSPIEADRPFNPAQIVAFVESKPDEVFQAQLVQERERRMAKPGSYERLCLRIYRAWTSNAELVMGELAALEID
jgi:transcriptional regulator with XRE-family HTH domain